MRRLSNPVSCNYRFCEPFLYQHHRLRSIGTRVQELVEESGLHISTDEDESSLFCGFAIPFIDGDAGSGFLEEEPLVSLLDYLYEPLYPITVSIEVLEEGIELHESKLATREELPGAEVIVPMSMFTFHLCLHVFRECKSTG